MSRGQGEAAAVTVATAAASVWPDELPGGVERVCRRVVGLIYAGWVPQDGTFESELAAGLEIERNRLQDNTVAHRTGAGHSQTLADIDR